MRVLRALATHRATRQASAGTAVRPAVDARRAAASDRRERGAVGAAFDVLAKLAAQRNRTGVAEDGLGAAGAGTFDKAAEGAGVAGGAAIGGIATAIVVTVLVAVLITVTVTVIVLVVIAVVSAGGRIDGGGPVMVSAAGVADGRAALVGGGRADAQAAERPRQQPSQQPPPRAGGGHGPGKMVEAGALQAISSRVWWSG